MFCSDGSSPTPASRWARCPFTWRRADNLRSVTTGMTDAFGNFAIRLTDGEWTVNVRMPSGRFYQVRTVTVKNGKSWIIRNDAKSEI